MIHSQKPFIFRQCSGIAKPTGKTAKNLEQLRGLIALVSPASSYHHTYQHFLKGHILEYTNDYYHFYDARARHGVDDFPGRMLAGPGNERLAARIKAIDPFMHGKEAVRARIIKAVDDELATETGEGAAL